MTIILLIFICIFLISASGKDDRDWNRAYPRNRDMIASSNQQRYSAHYTGMPQGFGPAPMYPGSESGTGMGNFPRDRYSPGEWRDYRRDYEREFDRRHQSNS